MVPVRTGRRVVLQWQLTTAIAPAQRLYGDSEVLLEVGRVEDVPTVKTKALLEL